MTRSPHQLLSQVSEHKRDIEADALKQLTTYRGELEQIIDKAAQTRLVLQQQRDLKMVQGTQATELMMLEISLHEQQQQIHDVSNEIEVLDVAIAQQRKKWADQHKKCKAHEKMFHDIQRTTERKQEQKQQKNLDDQYSSKMFAKGRV